MTLNATSRAWDGRALCRRYDDVEAMLRTAHLELDAARALAKSQAEALVDVAESEKTASRSAQVGSPGLTLSQDRGCLL